MSLPLDPSRKTGYKTLLFRMQLVHRYVLVGWLLQKVIEVKDAAHENPVGLYKLNSVVTHSLKAPGFQPLNL
jgi:hypothetical protein